MPLLLECGYYVVPPADPKLMIGTETANSVQITWHIANDDLVCGIMTYHVMIIVTDDERLMKQDTTRNTIYTFDGLSP